MKLTTLEAYVQEKKQWYLDQYGKLDWQWWDEGLIWAIQDYVSMTGEFTEEDVEFLHGMVLEPEEFLREIEEDE